MAKKRIVNFILYVLILIFVVFSATISDIFMAFSIIFIGLTAGVIIIGKGRVTLKKKATTESEDTSGEIADINLNNDGIRAGHIKCPKCGKEIAEGSSFCPECGYHIPKFLRIRQ
ncbi:MAG: zinc-ribbon domain-containing protein [Promethearchaeota archaeon]